MTESDSSINFDNLGKIYNFLLGKDEKDLISSLTPEGLETSLKIAQFYAGGTADKTVLATVADCTLEEFKQKNAVKEKNLGTLETAQQNSVEKTAHELYQQLHPVYRYRENDETSGLLSLPNEIRQVEILLKLGGKDLARASGAATELHEDIYDKTGYVGMNLMKRLWLEKARSLVAQLDPSLIHTQRQMYKQIALAQIAIHDFEGAKETMKDCDESDLPKLNEIFIKETAEVGDFEGAIRRALQFNEEPYVAKKTPATALNASKHLFLIAEIEANKGMQEKALATLKLGEDTLKFGKESVNINDIDAKIRFDYEASTAIIFGYARIGEIKAAEEKNTAIFNDIKRSSGRGSLVYLIAKSGDIQKAKELANQSNLPTLSFIRIAECQLDGNDQKGASKTVEEAIGRVVEHEKMFPTSVYYPFLIRILIRLNDMNSALIFYHKLSSYNEETFGLATALVEGLASNGEIEKVRDIAYDFGEHLGYTRANQLIIKAALICAQKGNLKQAFDLCKETGEPIRSWVARMLVAAGEFQKAKEEMVTWVAEFDAPDDPYSDHFYDPYSEYVDDLKRMLGMLAEMVKEQVRRGKIDDALQTIAEMEQLPTKKEWPSEKQWPSEREKLPIEAPLLKHLADAYHENLAQAYLALAGG